MLIIYIVLKKKNKLINMKDMGFNNKKLNLYIEFVGPAGTGKTTLGKLLLKELIKKGYDCVFRAPLFTQKQKIKVLFKKIIFSIYLIKYLNFDILLLFFNKIKDKYYMHGITRKAVNNTIQRRLIDYMVIRYMTTKKNYDFLINDEGLTKLIGLSVITNLSQKKLFRIAKKNIPAHSILIFLDVDDNVTMEREKKRDIELPFLNKLDNFKKKELYRKRKIIRNIFYKNMLRKKEIKVMRIKNNGKIRDSSKRINQFVIKVIKDFA